MKVGYTTAEGFSSTAYVAWDGIAWVGTDKHTDEPVTLHREQK